MDNPAPPWLNPWMRPRFPAPLLPALALAFALAPCARAQQPPVFTTQPVSVAAFVGEPLVLSVAAAGDAPLTYQWHKDTLPLAGATGSTLSFPALALTDTGSYYAVATNSAGTALSFTAVVFVTRRPQTIAFEPAVTTATAGSSLALAASATSQLPVTLSLVSGAASLSGGLLTGDGGTVVVRATQAGNTLYAAAEAVERTFSFITGGLSPAISSGPADQTVLLGTAVTLRAAVLGLPTPTLQWQKDGAIIAGATTSALTLASVTLADAGRYSITATNSVGTASAGGVLTVRAAPVIAAPPASRTIAAGEGVAFSVGVTAFPAPTYQWRRNGVAIVGATRDTFTIASASAADAARYDVVVANALGTATSAAATLAVTVRDFSGAYFGRFAGGAGEAALFVRADRTAVFLGHLPDSAAGLAVLDATVDLAGRFSVAATTLGPAPRAATVRGAIDEVAGTAAGEVTGLGLAFEVTRAPRTGAALALAGLYPHALVGSAAGRGRAIVGADGQVLLFVINGSAVDSLRGTLAAAGRFAGLTAAQAAVEATFSGGLLTGTLRAGATTTPLAGALEALAGADRLINLSVRSLTSPGVATLIAGFVIGGTAGKQVLVRAAGPALAVAPFNLPGALPDPTIQLLRGAAVTAQNNDWGAPAANVAALTAATTRAGAFAFRPGSADAALVATLQPGAYTATIGGGTGTVLAEVYEVLDTTETPGVRRLANVSARGIVAPNSPLIAGFVIGGVAPQRVLLRAAGPGIGGAPFNVAGALPNPTLTLFRGATAVKANDDWFRDPDAALVREAAVRAGAFAFGAASADAAIAIYLEPGAYTVQVGVPAGTPVAGQTGLALVEIYEAAP
jgi:hypothetical protein